MGGYEAGVGEMVDMRQELVRWVDVVGSLLTILTQAIINEKKKFAMLYYTHSMLLFCVIHSTKIACIITILLCV